MRNAMVAALVGQCLSGASLHAYALEDPLKFQDGPHGILSYDWMWLMGFAHRNFGDRNYRGLGSAADLSAARAKSMRQRPEQS